MSEKREGESVSYLKVLAWVWLAACAALMLAVMVHVSGWLHVVGLFALAALTTLAFEAVSNRGA